MPSGTATPSTRRSGGRVAATSLGEARYEHLFESLRGSATAMVRRAFGSAFSEDELEDFYSSAWLSTLAALDRKPRKLTDDELRRYLMTAVANQASREMRRRGRKPTVSLDAVGETSDRALSPEEKAAQSEAATLTREILGSLPPRRRAVLVFRYGWDLEPSEVCGLVEGLSPRAYRKEIERGVAEVAEKMRLVQDGDWCKTREPLLRSVVAGLAGDEEKRQAEKHLANCRNCAGFVGRLNGHLHDLGGSIALAGIADGAGIEATSIFDRGFVVIDRAKSAIGSALGRSSETAEHVAGQVAASGGTRGAGVAGAGALAKLAGLGSVPKLVAACLGTGAAATACVAAGVVPGLSKHPDDATRSSAQKISRSVEPDSRETTRHVNLLRIDEAPAEAVPPDPTPAPEPPPEPAPDPSQPQPAPNPEESPPVEAPSPTVQEFEPVGVPVAGPTSAPSAGGANSGGGASPGSGGEFGP